MSRGLTCMHRKEYVANHSTTQLANIRYLTYGTAVIVQSATKSSSIARVFVGGARSSVHTLFSPYLHRPRIWNASGPLIDKSFWVQVQVQYRSYAVNCALPLDRANIWCIIPSQLPKTQFIIAPMNQVMMILIMITTWTWRTAHHLDNGGMAAWRHCGITPISAYINRSLMKTWTGSSRNCIQPHEALPYLFKRRSPRFMTSG